MKLTASQAKLLLEFHSGERHYAASSWPPLQALIRAGLVEVKINEIGRAYVVTRAGSEVARETKNAGW